MQGPVACARQDASPWGLHCLHHEPRLICQGPRPHACMYVHGREQLLVCKCLACGAGRVGEAGGLCGSCVGASMCVHVCKQGFVSGRLACVGACKSWALGCLFCKQHAAHGRRPCWQHGQRPHMHASAWQAQHAGRTFCGMGTFSCAVRGQVSHAQLAAIRCSSRAGAPRPIAGASRACWGPCSFCLCKGHGGPWGSQGAQAHPLGPCGERG